MIIYGTEVKGPFYPEKLSTLPVYTASDEGRVVYVDDDLIKNINKVDNDGLGKYYIQDGELYFRDGWAERMEDDING